MLRNIRIIILLVVLAILPFVAARANAQPVGGANEVSGAASFFRPLGTGAGTFNLDAAYGKYFDDPRWQWGIRQSYTLNHDDDTRDVWNAVTAPFINYQFLGEDIVGVGKPTALVPYLGGFVGAVWNDEDFTGTVGPQAGVKAWFTRSSFVGVQYRYEWFFDEIEQADEFQDSNHVVTIGFGYSWNGDHPDRARQ